MVQAFDRSIIPGRHQVMTAQQKPSASRFDLAAFGRAIERADVAYQVSRYTVSADIRVVDSHYQPPMPRMVRGRLEIHAWLTFTIYPLELKVTHLLDCGDRVAFSQRWRNPDGATVLATSTAELDQELIATQYTILA